MTTINVLFSSDKAEIVMYFASPQDQELYSDFGTLETSDSRWKAYYDAQPGSLQMKLPPPD